MQGSNFTDDELRKRREARRARALADAAAQREQPEDEELPKFSWSDTFAMIIAAYQVLLPMILAMIGVILAAYFLFRWMFS